MSNELTISPLGLKLIKAYEGFRPAAAMLVTGQHVIGFGHSVDDDTPSMLTREAAEAFLIQDLKPIEALVRDSVLAPISQSQFDALCSLVYNIGEDNFLSSNVRHALNNGRVLDAAAAFDEWRKAEIANEIYVVDALMRRRTAEKALFLRHDKGVVRAGRLDMNAQSDESFVPVSEDADTFDPDTGIVAQAPHQARSIPSRRREDGPLGVLTLSEIAPRTVFDPSNAEAAQAQDEDVYDFDPVFDDDETVEIPNHNAELNRAADTPSPIAVAAAEVSDRLDALIDTARLEPVSDAAINDDRPTDILNLKDELPRETPIAANGNEGASRRPNGPVVKGADAYIQKTKAKPHAANSKGESGLGAYAFFMFIGGCLLAGGLVTWLTNRAGLDDLTSLLVPMAVVTGAMMVIGSLYYMIKAALRRS